MRSSTKPWELGRPWLLRPCIKSWIPTNKRLEKMDGRYRAPRPPPHVVSHFQQALTLFKEDWTQQPWHPPCLPLEAAHQPCAPNNAVGSLNGSLTWWTESDARTKASCKYYWESLACHHHVMANSESKIIAGKECCIMKIHALNKISQPSWNLPKWKSRLMG